MYIQSIYKVYIILPPDLQNFSYPIFFSAIFKKQFQIHSGKKKFPPKQEKGCAIVGYICIWEPPAENFTLVKSAIPPTHIHPYGYCGCLMDTLVDSWSCYGMYYG